MVNKTSNKSLHDANRAKNDEFYTQLSDIEKELGHYKEHFKGKVIFCNCDDPTESNFWEYFKLNFKFLGLKKLVATHYDEEKPSYKLEMVKGESGTTRTELKQNGDFRSPECIELLKESDIIVTNPPFSLFREYIAQLMEYDKKFLIIGSLNAITYKECFGFIKGNRMWLGYNNGVKTYLVPDDYDQKNTFIGADGKKYAIMGNTGWYTNLNHTKRHEPLILYKKYSPSKYPHYDNYDAINVDKVSDIPLRYDGAMGVPITFLDKYNPKQFDIVSSNDIRSNSLVPFKEHGLIKDKDGAINGKPTYVRIVIKNKRMSSEVI